MKHQNLQIRTKKFALQVIKFCEGLPKDETSKILARQLLRSSTSVGANYRAACLAKSKPAFISKLGDVLMCWKKQTNLDIGSNSWWMPAKSISKLRHHC